MRDAAQWIDHLRRITTETPWMLQSEEDPLPTVLEQRSLLDEYDTREGSLAILATRPHLRYPGRENREIGDPHQPILGTLTLASGRSRRTSHAAELSMGIGRQWWGRGIGTLLMGAGLTWAAQSNIVRRVSLSVFQDNEVARHLYERVGFATEGVLRRYVRLPGPDAGARASEGVTAAERAAPAIGHEDLVVMGLWLGGER